MRVEGALRSVGRRRQGQWCRASVVALLVVAAVAVFAAAAQASVTGDLIFAKRIGTSGSPAGSWTVAAGPDGVTAVAGWKWSSDLGVSVPMVAKYSASGERKWLQTYTDLGSGSADAVAFDANGSIYVAATVGSGSAYDIVVIRYGSAGTLKWVRTYDGPAGEVDYVEALVIDKAGNVVVVGGSRKSADDRDWGTVVVKYDRDGTPLWAEPARFDPDLADPNAGAIWPYDAACDADGNVYVVGSSEYWDGADWIERAFVARFNAADGTRAWGQVYDSAVNPESDFTQVVVRGTVVVAVGSTWPDPMDALVVKYNTSGLQRYWREWGTGNTTGEWYGDVVMDGSYNIYVAGGQWSDYLERVVTMKLRPDLTTAWKATYLPTSDWAEGWYITRNSLGNVYVAGIKWTYSGDWFTDILTLKYSATGARKWARVWSAGGPGDDTPTGLVLGTTDGVYVAGEVTNVDDFEQAVLLKYKL
jgi:hypothetical protein